MVNEYNKTLFIIFLTLKVYVCMGVKQKTFSYLKSKTGKNVEESESKSKIQKKKEETKAK